MKRKKTKTDAIKIIFLSLNGIAFGVSLAGPVLMSRTTNPQMLFIGLFGWLFTCGAVLNIALEVIFIVMKIRSRLPDE